MTIRRFTFITGCVALGLWLAGCHCPSCSGTKASKTPDTPKQAEAPKAPVATKVSPTAEAPKPPAQPVAPAPVKKLELRVDCGAFQPYTDKLGNVWAADQELGAGMTWGSDNGMTVDREGVGIIGTDMPRIYETERYSMGSYKFTVPNGKYTVRLHFAETYEMRMSG